MSAEWYYKLLGEEIGPLSGAELRQHARDGKLTPEMYVRRGETQRWVTAQSIKGLFEKLPSRTAQPARPPAPPLPPISNSAPDDASGTGRPTTSVRNRSVSLKWVVVGTAVVSFLAICTVVRILSQRNNSTHHPVKPEIKISDIFREQLIKFLEASGELDAATEQGVNILTMKQHLAKVKSSYELVSATWPQGFEPDAHKSFDQAIEGWELALELWAARIAPIRSRPDPPTEPDINGYAQYMAYAGDALETRTSYLYKGRKQISRSDRNVGVLLTLASTHCKIGKAAVLAALSENP